MANECNEVFPGDAPCQYGVNFQRFGDSLCLCHQELTWLIASENFTANVVLQEVLK